MLDNQVLLNCLTGAIEAHKNWLNILKEIAQTKELKVLQTDCTRCGFGHFYYTFKPLNSQVLEIWKRIGDKHKTFHAFGTEMISAVRSNQVGELQQIYERAELFSKDLLSDFHMLSQIIESLSKEHVRIFE